MQRRQVEDATHARFYDHVLSHFSQPRHGRLDIVGGQYENPSGASEGFHREPQEVRRLHAVEDCAASVAWCQISPQVPEEAVEGWSRRGATGRLLYDLGEGS